MALTRKLLKSLGIDDEKIESIIDAHGETVDALKKERDDLKAAADAAQDVARERDDLKDRLSKAGDAAKVQAEFDAYKQRVETEKVNGLKIAAYSAMLKECGVEKEAFRAAIMKGVDLSKIELDESNGIKDADNLRETIKTECADFISTTETGGTPPTTPPTGGGKAKDAFEEGFDE